MAEPLRFDEATYRDADRLLRGELNAQQLIMYGDAGPGDFSLDYVQEFAAAHPAYRLWPQAFQEGRVVSQTVPAMFDRRYWRVNTGMVAFSTNTRLSATEGLATQKLTDAVVFSGVPLYPSGNTSYPYAPRAEDLRRRQLSVYRELGALASNRHHIPVISWESTVRAMLSGQVRMGEIAF